MRGSLEEVTVVLGGVQVLLEYRDLAWFGKYKFFIADGGGRTRYVVANVPGKNRTIKLHQLIVAAPRGLEVDHINGNGLDNRRCNLRIVTHLHNQNNQPKRVGSSSRFHGVHWEKDRKRWICQVSFNNTTKTIGRFCSEIEAAVAYNNELLKSGLWKIKRMNPV